MSDAALSYFERRDIVRNAKIVDVEIEPGRRVSRGSMASVLRELIQYEPGRVYPSHARIGHDTNLATKTVSRAIKGLMKLGIISRDTDEETENKYVVWFKKLVGMAKRFVSRGFTKSQPKTEQPTPETPAQTEPKTEKTTVVAHDGVKRSAAPKFTPPEFTPELIFKIKKQANQIGMVQTACVDAAIERGATPRDIAAAFDLFPRYQAEHGVNIGGFVHWFKTGKWPNQAANDQQKVDELKRYDRFKSEAEQLKARLATAIDRKPVTDEFLARYWWPLHKAGHTFDHAWKKFTAATKSLLVKVTK